MLAYASKRGPRRRLIASTTPATGGESRARLPTRNGRTRRAGCQAGPWFPTHPGPVCQCAHRFRPSVEPVTCRPDTAHRTSPPGTAPPAGPRPSGGRSETGRSQCRTSPRTSVTAKSAGGNTRTPGASDTLCGHKAQLPLESECDAEATGSRDWRKAGWFARMEIDLPPPFSVRE